jgi:protein CLEC16A
VYFLVRRISLLLNNADETQLPICSGQSLANEGECMDLTNCDLIACYVTMQKDQSKQRRFMVINAWQLIIIEPDSQRLGWGVAKYAVQLQQIDVNADKDDSRSLLIQVHSTHSRLNGYASNKGPMTLRCVFDDHIRSVAAKNRLLKGKKAVKQRKMAEIAKLIELPLEFLPSNTPTVTSKKMLSRSSLRTDCSKLKGIGAPLPGGAVVSNIGSTASDVEDSLIGSPIELNGIATDQSAVLLSVTNGGAKLAANYFRRKPTTKSVSSLSSASSARPSRDSSPKPEIPSDEMIPLANLSPKSSGRRTFAQLEDSGLTDDNQQNQS